jgi:hypothetical protein
MNLYSSIEETLIKAEAGALDSMTFFNALSTGQPEVFVFLFDEDTRLLVEPEHDYLLFLAMIILTCLQDHLDSIDLESLEDMSEHNWGLLEHTSIENISETVSRHPGYALYAFIEEACTPQIEHDVLSETAVELVYVKCKSLVDCAFFVA